MKRIAALITFLLWASFAGAQVNIFIPNGGRSATEEWVKEYTDGWLKRLYTTPPNEGPVIDPDPGRPTCTAQPAIPVISGITQTKINVALSATGISQFNWYIYKPTAPLLYIKSGTVSYTQNMVLSWTGDLPPGDYGLKMDAVNCIGTTSRNFIIPQGSSPTPCGSAPSITTISASSRTSLTFVWSGLNVPEIVWNIRQNGANIRSGSFVPSGSQTTTVSYAQIAAGTYELQLIGLTCSTQNPSMAFTLQDNTTPTPTAGARHIYMNMTGYGFTADDPTGLSPEHRERAEVFLNLNWQGVNFKGIDGIRANMKWYEYEPTEGTFRDDKLIAAINWCAARGIKFSVALIPWRREGDNMIPDNEKAVLLNGRRWHEEGDLPSTYKTYMPSMQSLTGYTKFKAAAKHLAQTMANYPNTVDYVSTATSDGEEYQMIRESGTFNVSGYSDIDISRWGPYSGGMPVPRPSAYTMDAWNEQNSTPAGRKWYEYQTDGLRAFHAAFVQGIREGAKNGLPRAAGMYAAPGAPTAVWDMTYKLNTIYSAGLPDQPTIIYTSEGDANVLHNKLMATDLNIGTFPGVEPAIEFDPDDANALQIRYPPWDADLSSAIVYDYSKAFFRRGGKIVHFAMAFNPLKIPQLAEGLYKLKTEFLDSNTGMTPIEEGNQITFPITRYSGLQEYRDAWGGQGGSMNKRVKIKLE